MKLFSLFLTLSQLGNISAQIVTVKPSKDYIEKTYRAESETFPVEEQDEIQFKNGVYKSKGKFGYKVDGEIVIKSEFEYLRPINNGLLLEFRKDGLYGIMSLKKKVIIPAKYNNIDLIEVGDSIVYRVRKKRDYGIVNSSNKVIIPLEHGFISYDFGLYFIENNERKEAVFDLEGNQLTDFAYNSSFLLNSDNDYICLKSDNFYTVLKNDFSLIIDSIKNIYPTGFFKHNNQMLKHPDKYTSQNELRYFAMKSVHNKFGVYDCQSDSFAIPQIYDDIMQDNNSHFVFRKGEKFGVVNAENTIKVEFKYDTIYFGYQNNEFDGKSAVVGKGGYYSLVNIESATELFPFKYVEIKSIYAGNYKAKLGDDTYQVLSESGSILNAGPFSEVGEFALGEAMVFTSSGMKYLLLNGLLRNVEIQPHKGFSNVGELFEAFKLAMKSDNEERLREFCRKIAPSEHIVQFMKRTGIQYRRFPDLVIEERKTTEDIIEIYFTNLNEIRKSYFIDNNTKVDLDLQYKLSPPVKDSKNTGRQYVKIDIVLQIGEDVVEVVLDHCLIMEGYIISFSDSIKRY